MTNSSWPLSLLEMLAIENDRVSSVPGTAMSTYWPGQNAISVGSISLSTRWRMSWVTGSFETTSATGLLDRVAGPDHLLVVVEQLDRDVLEDVRPAQQGEALLQLEVGQRERRVLVQLDVVAVEDERLARGALAFLAAVHERDALLGRGAQHRLVLVDLDLDADRLESHDMLVAHELPSRS